MCYGGLKRFNIHCFMYNQDWVFIGRKIYKLLGHFFQNTKDKISSVLTLRPTIH